MFLKATRKSHANLRLDKRKRDGVYSNVVAKALAAKLAQYPTSATEDEALLKTGSLSKRHRMAVQVRLGEKRVLQEALQLLQGDDEGTAQSTGKKAKRGT